jgi:hypothetical protein
MVWKVPERMSQKTRLVESVSACFALPGLHTPDVVHNSSAFERASARSLEGGLDLVSIQCIILRGLAVSSLTEYNCLSMLYIFLFHIF